jgi:lysophospholipase L1-like esterase
MLAPRLLSRYPQLDLTITNRGIGGNRTIDLLERWDKDCIGLKPDLVSIMIGVNNTWRRYDRNDPTPPERFYQEYRSILEQTRKIVGNSIVICEPFLVPALEERIAWREDLDPKIALVRRLAAEFEALYVPLDGLFAEQCTRTSPAYWAADSVHPTPAGHALIARAWIDRVLGPGMA